MPDYPAVLNAILADPRYQANLDWGQARPGHPEGTIRAHIAGLERNLELLKPRLSETDSWKLRILIHTHDSFKAEAARGVPIAHARSHASLARAFLAEFCDDAGLLAIVQYHDEPFALFRQFQFKGAYNQQRFAALMQAIPDWHLFLAFLLIDGCTEGKGREPLGWLFEQVAGKVVSSFTAADIW